MTFSSPNTSLWHFLLFLQSSYNELKGRGFKLDSDWATFSEADTIEGGIYFEVDVPKSRKHTKALWVGLYLANDGSWSGGTPLVVEIQRDGLDDMEARLSSVFTEASVRHDDDRIYINLPEQLIPGGAGNQAVVDAGKAFGARLAAVLVGDPVK